ncbi:hypothetical protein [Flagellimonas sp. S3867]|uniref:hypothetical protein n=1 Tax=Flagellimonas sp. S3867 TaxID=2768063 RepID=UPI001683EF7B|nr:hypothetical protein [Flagellimonas sp. S3867]
MKKLIVLNMVFTALIFISCSNDGPGDIDMIDDVDMDMSDDMPDTEDIDVFVVGSNGNEDNGSVPLQALLWVNGELIELTDGQTDAEALSVYVSGTDVYVAGYEYENGVSIAKYWKNGVGVPITDGSRDAIAYDILVNGDDVYIAGEEDSEIAGGKSVAKYWENGTSTSLTDGSKFATALSLTLSGNDLHVVGYESTGPGGVNVAKYWLNGSTVNLTDGTGFGWANDISIDQDKVYIALREDKEINGDDVNIASYWHDGQITVLETNTSFTGAFGILVDNDNIHVCGSSQAINDNLNLRYWLNGEILSDPRIGEASSITKHEDDVYYAGFTGSGSNALATYWKNDEMIVLPNNDFSFVLAYAIFVK